MLRIQGVNFKTQKVTSKLLKLRYSINIHVGRLTEKVETRLDRYLNCEF